MVHQQSIRNMFARKILALAYCAVALFSNSSFADTVTVPATQTSDGHFVIKINIKDKNGAPTTVNGIVDTGNGDGFVVSPATAANLGLPVGPATTLVGVGGTTTVNSTSIPPSNAGTTAGSQPADTTVSSNVQGGGTIAPGVPDNTLLLGNDY